MSSLYIGTSSWTFPDWPGVFYPDELPAQQFLRFYATQFNSVEVNTSFYGLPRPSTILNWLDNVPDGFTFALKAPRYITHEQRLVDCQQETLAFLDVIRSLGRAAAPGLLQLPPSMTRSKSGRTVAAFLDWLAEQLDGIRLAVEVRAHDLMTQAFAEFLVQRRMTMVLVDRKGTPDQYPLWESVLSQPEHPGFAYIRFIGDDRNKPPTNRELCRPQDDRLAQWSSRIANMLERGIDVYAYVHNPYEGHSPATVRRLLQRIDALHPVPVWSPAPLPQKPDDVSPHQLSLF